MPASVWAVVRPAGGRWVAGWLRPWRQRGCLEGGRAEENGTGVAPWPLRRPGSRLVRPGAGGSTDRVRGTGGGGLQHEVHTCGVGLESGCVLSDYLAVTMADN